MKKTSRIFFNPHFGYQKRHEGIFAPKTRGVFLVKIGEGLENLIFYLELFKTSSIVDKNSEKIRILFWGSLDQSGKPIEKHPLYLVETWRKFL